MFDKLFFFKIKILKQNLKNYNDFLHSYLTRVGLDYIT